MLRFVYFKVWGIKYNPSATNLVSVSEDKSINIYEVPPLS